MYICICKAVSDRRVRAAVQGGAQSLRDLKRNLGLGTCCGKCAPAARALIEEVRGENPPLRALAQQ